MKKILALLLTVGMVLGLFAGCGNSNTTCLLYTSPSPRDS